MSNEETYEKNSKYTFQQLLNDYTIEIPIIQRDYAQGRTTDNETTIRKELLDSIYLALVNKTSLDFDFVYGTVEKESKKLYPLDGQQRLTTFYLLYWYLAQKEGIMAQVRYYLIKFSYTTRVSSRDFCNMLVMLDYQPQKEVSVSSFIKDANGYYMSWDNDPTVKAMLVMLDAIHERFYDCAPLFNDLSLLTFNYLPMENYALTDDLYIKMNARGKALSAFENFKAKFIQHLRESDLPYAHFEDSIDGKWLDLLWDYRAYDNTIDDQFMNLFCYFTEMIFLLSEKQRDCESPFRKTGIRALVEYYDDEEKVDLLYELFDLWSDQKEVESFQDKIFSIQRKEGFVRLFDRRDTDLFGDIVQGITVTLQNKILLFATMMRLIRLGKDTNTEATKDYCRIVRNLLMKCRYFKKANYSYLPDFRFGRNGIPYSQFFVFELADSDDVYQTILDIEYEGINSESMQQEIHKAKILELHPEYKTLIHGLEDTAQFKSSIFNIVDYAAECGDERLIDDVERLFTESNSIGIMRALLSFGDYGIHIGYSALGKRVYYGNIDHWYEILSYSGEKMIGYCIVELLRAFRNESSDLSVPDALDNIIRRNLQDINVDDWRYCIVKYPSTISKTPEKGWPEIYIRDLVFAFEEFRKTTILHRMNGKTLNAAHAVPEYIEAARQLKDIASEYVAGQTSEDVGAVKLKSRHKTKTREGFYLVSYLWMQIAEDGEPCINEYEDEDEELIDAAIDEYESLPNINQLDRVEKLVCFGRIIDKKYSERYMG